MKILQLYSGQNTGAGDYIYRIEQPGRGLSALPNVTVRNVDLLELSDLTELVEWPLLILHHVSDPDLLPIVSARKAKGLRTVYELADHFLASQDHDPQKRRQGPPEYHWVMAELIRRCDAVQTTGMPLIQRYARWNRNIHVLPNLVSEVRVRETPPSPTQKMTIGWGGSLRHLADLQHIAEPLLKWVRSHGDTRLAIMAAPKIQTLFDALPNEQLLLQQPGTLQAYLGFLDALDVGIAPLLPTEFNACRSDVKYLEFASREVVPVCSRFGPYVDIGTEGKNILLFQNTEELIRHLETLRSQPAVRRRIARAAREWVERHRLARTGHWKARADVYREWLVGRADEKEVTGAVVDGDRQLVASLLNQSLREPNPTRALTLIKEAAERAPRHYQTHYFLGWALCKAGRYHESVQELRRALAYAPASIRTVQLLARTLLLVHDFDGALITLEHGLKIEPSLPLLLALKGTVLQLQNRHREALAVLESCIGLEPCLVEAELAYVHSARVLGRNDEIEAVAHRLADLFPDSPEVTVIPTTPKPAVAKSAPVRSSTSSGGKL